jgi:hypothetical protein
MLGFISPSSGPGLRLAVPRVVHRHVPKQLARFFRSYGQMTARSTRLLKYVDEVEGKIHEAVALPWFHH